MKYLIYYSLPNEIFARCYWGAKNERALSTYISMLVNKGAYNIEVELQN